MIIPIRCFSCGKPSAGYISFCERRLKGEDVSLILDSLGRKRPCCRALFMKHLPVIDDIVCKKIKQK